MTDRLALPRRYRDQLEALLREHVPGVEVWAYGSRVNGESHEPRPEDDQVPQERETAETDQFSLLAPRRAVCVRACGHNHR